MFRWVLRKSGDAKECLVVASRDFKVKTRSGDPQPLVPQNHCCTTKRGLELRTLALRHCELLITSYEVLATKLKSIYWSVGNATRMGNFRDRIQ